MKSFIILLLLAFSVSNNVAIDRLVGEVWYVEGYFEDGDYLYQEYEFSKENDSIYLHKTFAKKSKYSELYLLSENRITISQNALHCDLEDTTLNLHITTQDRNIYFDYDYTLHGKNLKMRDSWIYEDDSTFRFQIGEWDSEKYLKIYMDTQIIRK